MAKKKKIVRPQYISKEQRARQAPKKPMAKWLKLSIIYCSIALVIAIILFAIFYDDGSLPMQDGNVVMEDNWIVVNKGTSSDQKYYKVGEIAGAIDGFAPDEGGADTSNSSLILYNFHPEDESSRITRYSISGTNAKAESVSQTGHDNFVMYYPDMEIGDVQKVDLHGHAFYYFASKMLPTTPEEEVAEALEEGEDVAAGDEDAGDAPEPEATDAPDAADEDVPAGGEDTPEAQPEETEAEQLTQQMYIYVPAIRDTSVLITVTINYGEDQPEMTDEELQAIADSILHTIVLDEK